MKKTISILVIVAMMLASLLAIIPVAAAEPEGTAIATAEQFAAMTADGKYYLANDITLNASYGDFKGTFDGNGKTITLSGNAPAFKVLTGATVKNVKVVAAFEAASLNGSYGALAGTANGGTYTGISADVELTFTTPVTNNISAIFGEAKGTTTITDCVADGFVKIPHNTSEAEKGTGGIVGAINGGATVTIINCTNYFDIESFIVRGSNGGIVGRIVASTATIEGCVNYGTVTTITGKDGSGNTHCGNGGIVGQFESPGNTAPKLDIKNSRNYADVSALDIVEGGCKDAMVGGILGRVYGAKYVTIDGCINSGNVTNERVGNWASAGGIIGNVETYNFNWSPATEADFVAKNSINLGNVTGGNAASGIFGSFMQANAPGIRATIMDCANYGDVTGSLNAGGAFALASGGGTVALTVTNFYNAGNIDAGVAGGIVGNLDSGWDTGSNTKDVTILQDADGNPAPFPTCTFTNCISEGAVTGGGTIIGKSNNAIVLNKCASTAEGAISGTVGELTENETPTDIEAAKTALLAILPADPTEVTELVQAADGFYADDYEAGWDAYSAAIETAKLLINSAQSVETLAEVVELINAAKEDLVLITDIKRDNLDEALAATAGIENTGDAKYTPATWTAYAAALKTAQEIGDGAKQSAINRAAEALVAAIAGLELIPDLTAINDKITTAKAVDATKYVSKTVTALNDAVAKAETLIADVNATNAQVEAAIAEIDAATAALAAKVDPQPLADKAKATSDQYKPADYTAVTYGKVKGAVQDAEDAVKSNDMSQADLDALAKAIDKAVEGLKKKATWADTEAFLATIADLRETDYTPESWADYTKALAAVELNMKEDKKPNVSVDDEAKLLEELKAKYDALVSYATYDALDARVGELESLDETKYTAESWKALQDAIKAANALKSDRYATQPQADEALAAINAAVDALVEASANAGTDAPTATDAPKATTAVEEKSGCGGVIATTAVVMTSVLALGAAFVAKKKED